MSEYTEKAHKMPGVYILHGRGRGGMKKKTVLKLFFPFISLLGETKNKKNIWEGEKMNKIKRTENIILFFPPSLGEKLG